jgi:hypothetical protein
MPALLPSFDDIVKRPEICAEGRLLGMYGILSI